MIIHEIKEILVLMSVFSYIIYAVDIEIKIAIKILLINLEFDLNIININKMINKPLVYSFHTKSSYKNALDLLF